VGDEANVGVQVVGHVVVGLEADRHAGACVAVSSVATSISTVSIPAAAACAKPRSTTWRIHFGDEPGITIVVITGEA
jgi:hypothetical protein